nr:2994_t:CDS:2 [Entrophospora candida]
MLLEYEWPKDKESSILYEVVKEESEEKLSRSFSVPQYWKNVNLIRAVELHDPIVRESISYNVENIHEEPIDEYYFPIAEKWHDHLSYIEAKGKKTKILNVEKAEFDLANRIQYYKIYFDQRIESKGKYRFEVKLAYTHVLRPYPYEIDQNDKQYLVYEGNVYGNSAYFTENTKTNINHTEKPHPVTRLGNMISYGLYVDKEPNSYEKMVVHYEQIAAILTVRKLRRDLEISHWGGNLAVEEHLDIINDGAKLKGQFSRYKFQQSLYKLNEIVVIRDLKVDLPATSKDIYYRDEIGNVSTSSLKHELGKTVLQLRPRYPLFGGWNYTWYHGYNLPINHFVRYNSESDRYILNVPFINLFPHVTYDQVQVRVILPEGARNVKMDLPFSVDKEIHSIHKTYLDTSGRYMITIEKNNLINEHHKSFQVSYQHSTIDLLEKPFAASTFFLGGFILSMMYSRMEFSLGK